MRARQAGTAALAAAVAACAYFNGLYNAQRLAHDGDVAAADGRTGEARSLWQQAAVKAESVAVRFPSSRHHDDALLLWGEALSRLGECSRAISPLADAVRETPDPEVQRRARLALGRCLVITAQADSGISVLDPLAESDGPSAGEARLWRGRAYMALGLHPLAIADFSATTLEGVEFDRALAYLAMDSLVAAHHVLEPLRAARYHEDGWQAVAAAVRDANARAQLVDAVGRREDLTSGERARLYLAEARRLAREEESERAEQRFAAAAAAAPDSAAGAAGRAEAALLELRRSDDLGRLGPLASQMEGAVRAGVALGWPASRFAALLRAASAALADVAEPYQDLRVFRAAELVRDSVGAHLMAAALFRSVHELHPGSPLAPKALLAEFDLRGAPPEGTLAALERRYPDSPYARVLRGEPAGDFLALEDSLRTLLRRISIARQ